MFTESKTTALYSPAVSLSQVFIYNLTHHHYNALISKDISVFHVLGN